MNVVLDFGDLEMENMLIKFPNGREEPFYFEVVILPVEGYYKYGSTFSRLFSPVSNSGCYGCACCMY